VNVLFLNSIEVETYGGMEEWIRLAATGLAARGHGVILAGRPGSEYLSRAGADETVRRFELAISGDFHPATISRLARFISKNAVNIVVVNFTKDIRVGGLSAALNKDVPVIWSVGLDITKDSLSHRILTPRLIDGVITPSRALADQIVRSGVVSSDMIEVIPVGIPGGSSNISRDAARKSLRSRFNINADEVVAVTSGRFVEQKGHRYLVDAAPGILHKAPNVKFLLLGDGPLRDQLQAQIHGLGLSANFIFAGMLGDVAPFLDGCDIMIHPSVEEPFGIAVLEGMRAGLPVIASRTGGLPEVVAEGETAMLVEPRSSKLLADAAIGLLRTPVRMSEMGAAGRNRWQTEFLFERMIDRIEKRFKSFVGVENHG